MRALAQRLRPSNSASPQIHGVNSDSLVIRNPPESGSLLWRRYHKDTRNFGKHGYSILEQFSPLVGGLKAGSGSDMFFFCQEVWRIRLNITSFLTLFCSEIVVDKRRLRKLMRMLLKKTVFKFSRHQNFGISTKFNLPNFDDWRRLTNRGLRCNNRMCYYVLYHCDCSQLFCSKLHRVASNQPSNRTFS